MNFLTIKKSIRTKILGGFLGLIVVLIGSVFFLTTQLNNHIERITENTQKIENSLKSLKELRLLLAKSKMLVSAWVIIPNNHVDKDELRVLHEREYQNMKAHLGGLSLDWEKENQRQLQVTFQEFEEMLSLQQEIMQALASFEDYDDINTLIWQSLIENDISQVYKDTELKLRNLIEVKENQNKEIQEDVLKSSNNLRWFAIIVSLVAIAFGIGFAYPMANSIINPINSIRKEIYDLSKGVLPQRYDKKAQDYEIQQMGKTVDALMEGVKKTAIFAEKIGQGEYDTTFQALSQNDILGNSLLKMRDNLKIVAQENEERRWFNEGISSLSDMLKNNFKDLELLSDDVLRLLVKHLGANQRRLFVVQKTGVEEAHHLFASYAWGKKKYIQQRVLLKEGITGQAWKEKKTVYLTDIPQDYVTITSGLGHTTPRSLVVVPMILNGVVFGVLELASLQKLSPIEITFIEKSGENIASSISIIQNTLQSQRFLKDFQYMTKRFQIKESNMKKRIDRLLNRGNN